MGDDLLRITCREVWYIQLIWRDPNRRSCRGSKCGGRPVWRLFLEGGWRTSHTMQQ